MDCGAIARLERAARGANRKSEHRLPLATDLLKATDFLSSPYFLARVSGIRNTYRHGQSGGFLVRQSNLARGNIFLGTYD